MDLTTYGAIFAYQGEKYVYLASNGRVTAAAKIVARKRAYFVDRHQEIMMQGTPAEQAAARDSRLYYYVELKTDGYTGDVAHLEGTDDNRDEASFMPTGETLCREDQLALQGEIKDAPIPRWLKRQIADLEIE